VGGTVRWEWASSIHSVVSGTVGVNGVGMPDGLFCSPNNTNCLNPPLSNAGDVYEHTFNQAGTFPYFCSPHASSGMVGMVIVQP
jgi:plastocyanin